MVLLPPTAFEKNYIHCNQFTIRTCVDIWILLTSFRHIVIISVSCKILKILRKAQRDSWFLPPTSHQRTCFESNLRENVRKANEGSIKTRHQPSTTSIIYWSQIICEKVMSLLDAILIWLFIPWKQAIFRHLEFENNNSIYLRGKRISREWNQNGQPLKMLVRKMTLI